MPVSEELTVLQEVAQRLQSAGIPYMVTGSIAVNYYAVPRMTRDIDIVLEVGTGDMAKVWGLFARDYYMDSEAVQDALAERGRFNIIHSAYVIKVDFIVRKDEPYRHEEFKRRRVINIEGVEIAMMAPEDLVLSKLVWAKDTRSEMHLGDIRNVLESVPGLDYAYLERWATHLGVVALYQEVSG